MNTNTSWAHTHTHTHTHRQFMLCEFGSRHSRRRGCWRELKERVRERERARIGMRKDKKTEIFPGLGRKEKVGAQKPQLQPTLTDTRTHTPTHTLKHTAIHMDIHI